MARTQIPVTDITRLGVAGPTLVPADITNGHYFDNPGGNVFIEAISSTFPVNFTVLTGLVIEDEWAVADTLCTVSQANTSYYFGKFPANIFNVGGEDTSVYIDPAVSAVLQFRAWRAQ